MKSKKIYPLASLILISFLFSNCASLTGFETGKTVGKDRGFISASLNASRTPDFDLDQDEEAGEGFFFPNIELGGRYGVAERFDVGMKANTNLNVMLDGKFQLVGDQDSPAAISVGAGVGTFALFFGGLWNVQVPVYFSMHPSEKLAVYVTPRYTRQFAAGDIPGGLNYMGGNAGILIGEKNKLGLDFGIYNLSATGEVDVVSFLTFGIGGVFFL